MRARLRLDFKIVRPDGLIVQMRVWDLPAPTAERPHGLKYSFFFGSSQERIVGYDNEAGKGDHCHYRNREERYVFRTLEQMIDDFEADVEREIGDE